jgi:hypothetical protein
VDKQNQGFGPAFRRGGWALIAPLTSDEVSSSETFFAGALTSQIPHRAKDWIRTLGI